MPLLPQAGLRLQGGRQRCNPDEGQKSGEKCNVFELPAEPKSEHMKPSPLLQLQNLSLMSELHLRDLLLALVPPFCLHLLCVLQLSQGQRSHCGG